MMSTVRKYAFDTEFAAEVAKYIDMDTFLTESAIEQFMADWDGGRQLWVLKNLFLEAKPGIT